MYAQEANDCPRLGRMLGGCKFRPRYDTVAPTDDQLEASCATGADEFRALAGCRYICDVCERCGKTVNWHPVLVAKVSAP